MTPAPGVISHIKKIINVVLYARVSTKRQAENEASILEQIRRMKIYCEEKDYRIVGIYKDEGASARTEKRPTFQKMILDLTSGRVQAQAVIVLNRTRYFRDVYGAQKYERILDRKGIEIISLDLPTEGMDLSAKHYTTILFDAAGQYHSELDGVATLGGMLGNARLGYYNGGKPLYGYRSVKILNERGKLKSKLVVCSTEKEQVRRIFSLYLRSFGGGRIAKILNDEGVRWRNGKRWKKAKILEIIANPIHKGEYIYNRRVSRTKRENPESEWVRVKVEPTVDEETFNLAQRIRERNAPTVTNPAIVSSPLLLTGLLVCGLCGSAMSLETGKSGRYRYYNCTRYLREKSCPGQRVRVEILDREVVEHMSQKLFSIKRLSLLLREFLNDMKRQRKGRKGEEAAIQSEIRGKEGELENVYLAIRKGIVKEGNIDEVIGQLKGEIAVLRGKLSESEKATEFTLPPHAFSPKFLREFQLTLSQTLGSDVSRAKSYLRLLLSKVRLNGRSVTLVAKKNILLGAILANDQPKLAQVPTAGRVWLPGRDSNRPKDAEDFSA